VTAREQRRFIVDHLKFNLPPQPELLNLLSGRQLIVAFRDRLGSDVFNDYAGIFDPVVYRLTHLWDNITADPGRAPRFGQGRIDTHDKGVLRLRPGLHLDVYKYGYHHGRDAHPCMDQIGLIPGERFNPDLGEWLPTIPENRGCNIHRAQQGGTSPSVGDYSHGCIVFASHEEHWDFLKSLGYPEHGLRNSKHPVSRHILEKTFSLYLADITPARATSDLRFV